MTPTQSIPARGQAQPSLLDLGRGFGPARFSGRAVLPATCSARPFLLRGPARGRAPGAAGDRTARRVPFFPCASVTGRSRGRVLSNPHRVARPRIQKGGAA